MSERAMDKHDPSVCDCRKDAAYEDKSFDRERRRWSELINNAAGWPSQCSLRGCPSLVVCMSITDEGEYLYLCEKHGLEWWDALNGGDAIDYDGIATALETGSKSDG